MDPETQYSDLDDEIEASLEEEQTVSTALLYPYKSS